MANVKCQLGFHQEDVLGHSQANGRCPVLSLPLGRQAKKVEKASFKKLRKFDCA